MMLACLICSFIWTTTDEDPGRKDEEEEEEEEAVSEADRWTASEAF